MTKSNRKEFLKSVYRVKNLRVTFNLYKRRYKDRKHGDHGDFPGLGFSLRCNEDHHYQKNHNYHQNRGRTELTRFRKFNEFNILLSGILRYSFLSFKFNSIKLELNIWILRSLNFQIFNLFINLFLNVFGNFI